MTSPITNASLAAQLYSKGPERAPRPAQSAFVLPEQNGGMPVKSQGRAADVIDVVQIGKKAQDAAAKSGALKKAPAEDEIGDGVFEAGSSEPRPQREAPLADFRQSLPPAGSTLNILI